MRRVLVWLAFLLVCVGCGDDDETESPAATQLDAGTTQATIAQTAEAADMAEVEEAVLAYRTMSKSDGWDVRATAIKRIEHSGAHAARAIPVLQRTLDDRDDHWLVRSEAVCALAAIGPQTLPYLRRGLDDPFVRVRWTTAYALRQLVADSDAAATLLEETLLDKNQHWRVRTEAALSLTAAGSAAPAESVVPALAKALQDSDARVQTAAASSLARLGPQATAAIPALRQALSDKQWEVRSAAVYALGRIGPEAVPALRAATEDDSWAVRSAAADALRALGQTIEPATDDSKQPNGQAPAPASPSAK